MRLSAVTPAHLNVLLLTVAVLLIGACTAIPPLTSTPAAPEPAVPGLSGTLNGTVTYLPRIALAPDAVVEVTLQDVSRADAAATTLASQTIRTQGAQAPIAYSLTYDPAQIEPRNSYAVRATITEGGRLTWTSTRHHGVLTRDEPTDNVEIIVEQVK
jgi:uncharacterized lipoprotein YbaY